LVKGREELVRAIGFDPTDPPQLANHLKRIEYLVLTNQSHTEGFEDPFELMCRNNLAYQLLTCKYHRPLGAIDMGGDEVPTQTAQEASVSTNHASLNALLLGVTHKCPVPTLPLTPFQTLDEVKDEVWKLKFDRSGTHLLATTRNRFIHCWALQEGKFNHIWKTQLEAKEDINDYSVSETRSRVCVATQNSSVIILDLATGARMPSIPKAHTDIVTSIYCFSSGEDMLTAGVDGFLVLWNGSNEKTREVKTKRVAGMAVAPSEAFLLLLHSNSLFMDRVDLDTHRIVSNLIREKHAIISHQIDPTSTYLLVNTSFDLPELHLWRLSDGALLNIFTGHTQRQFAIACSFLSDNLICCGSETGALHIWHVHDPAPLATEKRHELPLSAIAVARPAGGLPFVPNSSGTQGAQTTVLYLATGSDDGHIIISR
jgi:WD40 repeat protein